MVKRVGLKSLLRNFLNHYETLESRHKSCLSGEDSIDLYVIEFQTLKELTESLKSDPNCNSNEGENDVNKRKNRYKDILPYDHSRVILSEYPGVPGSDYMNANYVRGSSGSRAYIASQGPLPNTVVDFWRMIWETEITVIVMACNEREAGKYKCDTYWPQDNDEKQQYGNITVELVKWRQVCPDFLVRTLKVTADSTERTVCQFHYQTWPDHGVPTSVHPILELVRLMRDVQASESRPILVHCSAGCGRTGTICSIDYVWALLRTGKLKEDFSLFSIIKEMRRQRIAMVQTVEQYMLCYKAVSTLFEQQLKMIDAHTYENIDGDGEPIMSRPLMDDNSSVNVNSRESDDNSEQNDDNVQSERLNLNPNKLSSESTKTPNFSIPSNNDEVRHEKLIGKATVIRRPSIAKLKAIFENNNTTPSEPTIVRMRPNNSSLQRSLSIKDNQRISRSIMDDINQEIHTNDPIISNLEHSMPKQNYFDQNVKQNQKLNKISINSEHIRDQNISNQFNPLNNRQENPLEDMHSYEPNQRPLIQTQNFNLQFCAQQTIDQKMYEHNQQLQQQLRQHLILHQQKQEHFHQLQMIQNQTLHHRIEPHIQTHFAGPPKPPRTYQHIVEDVNSQVPNVSSEGRLIVSVALPRNQSNEVNQNIHSTLYEPLVQRRCNITAQNIVSDSALVKNSAENYSNDYMNGNNTANFYGIPNNKIYESVLPKYRTNSSLDPNVVQNFAQTHYDVIKLRNNGLNSNLPYDSIYARRGFMTVPNLRHIQAQPVNQVPPFQFKPNFENIYSTNNLNKNIINRNEKSNTERIPSHCVKNVNKQNEKSKSSEHLNKQNKVISDKKEPNLINNSNNQKVVHKNELSKTVSSGCASNSQSPAQQESNSGSFFKISNAFKGLRMKSTKVKNKTNTNNNSSANNNVNGPSITRPPHSHRFSPPTQWTQV